MSRKRREKKENRRRIDWTRAIYAAGFFLPVMMIAAAALIPTLVFQAQDKIRCGKVVLDELENVDIASFNKGYETDLYRRLLRFAEGRTNGDSCYVAAQEMKPTEELTEFLASDRGLYQTSLLTWIDNGTIPTAVLDYGVRRWKQYVIYGDDFSAGVYFMLWYIELADSGSPTLKLLVDAETGDIYGISFLQPAEGLTEGECIEVLEESWTKMAGIRNGEDIVEMGRLWYLMACRYGGLEDSVLERILQKNNYLQMDAVVNEEEFIENEAFENGIFFQEIQIRYAELMETLTDNEIREILYELELMRWEISEDEKTHTYFFLYEPEKGELRYELPFSCRMENIMLVRDPKARIRTCLGEFLLGFPDIYEWIPEFTETEDSFKE